MTTILPILMLAVWTYLASCFEAESFQNLYVNRIRSLLFRPITALERIFPQSAPEWVAPLVMFALLPTFGAMAAKFSGTGAAVTFCGMTLRPANPDSFGAIAVTIISAFMLLVAKLSLLRVLLVWRLGPASGSSPVEFLETATWPVPKIADSASARPSSGLGASPTWIHAAITGAVFLAGAALALAASGAGATAAVGASAAPRLALAAAIDTLLVLRSMLLFFCICSFFGFGIGPAAWSGPGEWMNFLGAASRDWLGDIVRATIGREISFGAIGFAPLLLFLAIGLIHPFLASLVM